MSNTPLTKEFVLKYAAMHREDYYLSGIFGGNMKEMERQEILLNIRKAQKKLREDPQYRKYLKQDAYKHANIGQVRITTLLGHPQKCASCGEVKEPEEFYKNNKARSGRQATCKVCATKAHRARAQRRLDDSVAVLPYHMW